MKSLLSKLPRKRLIIIALIITILVFSGIAYAANYLTVNFGGGVGVSGNITVTAPVPKAEQVKVLSVPDFTIIAGSSDPYRGTIQVANNSYYELTLDNVEILTNQGIMEWDSTANNPKVNAGAIQNIEIVFYPSATSVGSFGYEGTLTYTW